MSAVKLLLLAMGTVAALESGQPVQFDCQIFQDITKTGQDEGLSLVRDFVNEHRESANGFAFERECINQTLKRNFIDAAEVMISEYFSKDPQRASQAESTARNAIDQVRNRQNDLLAKFEQIPKSVPVISPAFQWAQSANQTFLEVKYSTRFDSPACLDIFDSEFRTENDGKRLYLKAMCRNDKKLLKYELSLDLWGQVMADASIEESSVGRVFITLQKEQAPIKWMKLLAEGVQKPGNMNIWWELREKHEKELNDLFAPEADDETETKTKQKKTKEDKKKQKKGKKGEQQDQKLAQDELNMHETSHISNILGLNEFQSETIKKPADENEPKQPVDEL